MSKVDIEVVQVTAVQVIFDLLHFFGLKEFNIEPEVSEKPATANRTKDRRLSTVSLDDFEDAGAVQKTPERPEKNTEVALSVLTILTDLLDSDVSF